MSTTNDLFTNKYLGSEGVKTLWEQINKVNASYLAIEGSDIVLYADASHKTELSRTDASAFVKDSFLKSVEIINIYKKGEELGYDKEGVFTPITGLGLTEGNYIVFTWNTEIDTDGDGEAETTTTYIPFSDLAEIYTAGDGIEITTDKEIKVKNGNGLTIDGNGLKVNASSSEFTFDNSGTMAISNINATKSKTTQKIYVMDGPLANNVTENNDVWGFESDDIGKYIEAGTSVEEIIKKLLYTEVANGIDSEGVKWDLEIIDAEVHIDNPEDLYEVGDQVSGNFIIRKRTNNVKRQLKVEGDKNESWGIFTNTGVDNSFVNNGNEYTWESDSEVNDGITYDWSQFGVAEFTNTNGDKPMTIDYTPDPNHTVDGESKYTFNNVTVGRSENIFTVKTGGMFAKDEKLLNGGDPMEARGSNNVGVITDDSKYHYSLTDDFDGADSAIIEVKGEKSITVKGEYPLYITGNVYKKNRTQLFTDSVGSVNDKDGWNFLNDLTNVPTSDDYVKFTDFKTLDRSYYIYSWFLPGTKRCILLPTTYKVTTLEERNEQGSPGQWVPSGHSISSKVIDTNTITNEFADILRDSYAGQYKKWTIDPGQDVGNGKGYKLTISKN
jgi:hypothetical protein